LLVVVVLEDELARLLESRTGKPLLDSEEQGRSKVSARIVQGRSKVGARNLQATSKRGARFQQARSKDVASMSLVSP